MTGAGTDCPDVGPPPPPTFHTHTCTHTVHHGHSPYTTMHTTHTLYTMHTHTTCPIYHTLTLYTTHMHPLIRHAYVLRHHAQCIYPIQHTWTQLIFYVPHTHTIHMLRTTHIHTHHTVHTSYLTCTHTHHSITQDSWCIHSIWTGAHHAPYPSCATVAYHTQTQYTHAREPPYASQSSDFPQHSPLTQMSHITLHSHTLPRSSRAASQADVDL